MKLMHFIHSITQSLNLLNTEFNPETSDPLEKMDQTIIRVQHNAHILLLKTDYLE